MLRPQILVNRFERGAVPGEAAVSEAPRCGGLGAIWFEWDSVTVRLPAPQDLSCASALMVNVATHRMDSARVYLNTAFAIEIAIETLDQRLAATSASRAQQGTIEQIVDVSVPLAGAKKIHMAPALAVTQRHRTRTLAPDTTYAAPVPLIDHVTFATPARVEHVPQIFKETAEMVIPATPAPVIENVAVSPAVTIDGSLPVGYVAPAPGITYDGPAPVTEYVAPVLGAFDDVPDPDIDDSTGYLTDLKKQGKTLTDPLTGAAEREIVRDGIESMCFSILKYDTLSILHAVDSGCLASNTLAVI